MAQLQVTLEEKVRGWFQNVGWRETSVDNWAGRRTGRLKVLWVPADAVGNTSSKEVLVVPKATSLRCLLMPLESAESRCSAASKVQICWQQRCFPGSFWQRGGSSASLDIWHFSWVVGQVITRVVNEWNCTERFASRFTCTLPWT